jgi:hypothetical protein
VGSTGPASVGKHDFAQACEPIVAGGFCCRLTALGFFGVTSEKPPANSRRTLRPGISDNKSADRPQSPAPSRRHCGAGPPEAILIFYMRAKQKHTARRPGGDAAKSSSCHATAFRAPLRRISSVCSRNGSIRVKFHLLSIRIVLGTRPNHPAAARIRQRQS